jgi:pyruvate/2-oxoglutarate dehydrogenase complex dihydrolipoamide dehydrogenase (E3) component
LPSLPLAPDLCVIGAGAAGLAVAVGAAQMGASVVLVERRAMGGDCLNWGCVPSKSLLAATATAQRMRDAAGFGIRPMAPEVDFAAVHRHVHAVIAAIAPHDGVERLEGLGVKVLCEEARFVGPDEVAAGGRRIRARRFVIATGSRPALPPVPGLAAVPHLTNETVFDLEELPRDLLVLGGGPVGCELAQAFRRLGAAVALVDRGPILPRDDPELVAVVRDRLRAEGVELHEHRQILATEPGPVLALAAGAGRERLAGSHLLVAAGREPQVDGLDLEAAGIAHDRRGIKTDRRLRTTNARVFAIGDVASGMRFTHVASHHAGIVLQNALLRLPVRADRAAIPWVTYTDPELAAVGLSEAEAHGLAHEVLRWPFADNDRARTERAGEGLIKVVLGRRGRVLGAGIVGAHAGELILPWVLAVERRLPLRTLAQVVVPYPTLSEVTKRVAGSRYAPRLFGAGMRRQVRLLARLG